MVTLSNISYLKGCEPKNGSIKWASWIFYNLKNSTQSLIEWARGPATASHAKEFWSNLFLRAEFPP